MGTQRAQAGVAPVGWLQSVIRFDGALNEFKGLQSKNTKRITLCTGVDMASRVRTIRVPDQVWDALTERAKRAQMSTSTYIVWRLQEEADFLDPVMVLLGALADCYRREDLESLGPEAVRLVFLDIRNDDTLCEMYEHALTWMSSKNEAEARAQLNRRIGQFLAARVGVTNAQRGRTSDGAELVRSFPLLPAKAASK